MNRIFFILMGLLWGFLGISIILSPSFYHSRLKWYFDFSELKLPFGIFLIILGVGFALSPFRKKAMDFENQMKDREKLMMCPSCVKPIYKQDSPALECSICGNNFEELEGFYDRHPELKI